MAKHLNFFALVFSDPPFLITPVSSSKLLYHPSDFRVQEAPEYFIELIRIRLQTA